MRKSSGNGSGFLASLSGGAKATGGGTPVSNLHCRMEGYLIKKKGDYHKNKFFHYDSMRWFKLQEVQGPDQSELALCYFRSQKDTEPRSWIFVKDITEISDTENNFTVVSPARTLVLAATATGEMTSWLEALIECCPHADVSKVQNLVKLSDSKSSALGGSSHKESDLDYQEYQPLDRSGLSALNRQSAAAGKPARTFDRSESLFSRNADGGKSSFYFASSGQTQALADRGVLEHAREATSNDESDDHDRLLGEGETLAELGGLGRQSRSKDTSQNSKSALQRTGIAGERDKEDHRMSGYKYGTSTEASATSRLHRHITNERPPQGSRLPRRPNAEDADEDAEIAALSGDTNNPFGNDADPNCSTYANRGSPTTPNTPGRGFNTPNILPNISSATSDLSALSSPKQPPSSQSNKTEVEDKTGASVVISRSSRARIREKHRRRKQQQQRYNSDDSSDSNGDVPPNRSSSNRYSDSSEDDNDDGVRVTRVHSNSNSLYRSRESLRSSNNGSSSGSSEENNNNERTVSRNKVRAANSRDPVSEERRQVRNSESPNDNNPKISGAVPRKAKDALIDEDLSTVDSRGKQRISLDDIIAGRSESKDGGVSPFVSNSIDAEDEEDFKADFQKARSVSRDAPESKETSKSPVLSESSQTAPGKSRPPRPPAPSSKPPYGMSNPYSASAAAVLGKNFNGNANGSDYSSGGKSPTVSTTAPQQTIADAIRRGTSTPPRKPGDAGIRVDSNFATDDWDAEDDDHDSGRYSDQKRSDYDTREETKQSRYPTTVRADPNWLEEDFDN